MDKSLKIRIINWLHVNKTERADVLEAASRAGTVAMRADQFVQVGEILREILENEKKESNNAN